MVKAPSSHGLDRKFKPWRRGKSQNSNKRSSLKQQLRGHERLLKRSTDEAHKQSLLQKVEELKQEIAGKQVAERERKNAKQSHGTRFLERQKLVRGQHNAEKEQNSDQLDRIALDQIYVGHYPLDTKYLCLFRNGHRRTDPLKVLSQRARIRHRILFQQLPSAKHKDWISTEQYSRVEKIIKNLSSWTVEEERRYFDQEEDISSKTSLPKDDSRFTVAPQHEALLAAAEEIEKQLNNEDELQSSDEGDDSSSSDSDTDPLRPKETSSSINKPSFNSEAENEKSDDTGDSTSDDSSTSSSSSDESVASQHEAANQGLPGNDANENAAPAGIDQDDGDDFLVDLDDNKVSSENVFSNPRQHVEPFVGAKGDKSKGWATQKQRPGQWKAQKDHAMRLKKRRKNGK